MPSIFIAIASLDDNELISSVISAIGNARNPDQIYFGISYVGIDKLLFNRLVEEIKPFTNRVAITFTEVTKANKDKVLGIGVNRAAALSLYSDQDYVLQVDSHTLFSAGWDTALIGLHTEATVELAKKHVILTAYAGHYYFDKETKNRVFKAGNDVFQYCQFIKNKWLVGEGAIPSWNAVVPTGEQVEGRKFLPASKFNANFAFGDKWFAKNSGVEADFVFFDEEIRQTINLIELGATLVHPVVNRPLIGHLYSEEFTKGGPGSRLSLTDYFPSDTEVEDIRSRTKANYEKFLSNPSKAKYIRMYEQYMKVSLKFGTAREFIYIPEYFLGEDETTPRQVRPWDLLNPKMEHASEEAREARMEICRSCKFFVKLTQQCKKCGCIMPAKTLLADAACPIHKWEATTELSS